MNDNINNNSIKQNISSDFLSYNEKSSQDIDDEKKDIQLINQNDIPIEKVKIFKPKLTRNICSVFEYTRIITELANYLSNVPDLSNYIEDIDVDNIIEPYEVAYVLLRKGKFNAIIDRGVEKVSLSELYVDSFIYDLIEEYITQQEKERKESLLNKIFNDNNN